MNGDPTPPPHPRIAPVTDMEKRHITHIFIAVVSLSLSLLALYAAFCYLRARWLARRRHRGISEAADGRDEEEGEEEEPEGLIVFLGGEDLTVQDILEAPGEVVGKSGYSTLYRASLAAASGGGVVALLRFIRPACVGRADDIIPAVRVLGIVRHPNLVPLCALYVGPCGEKLFVHPFYSAGSLSQFIRDGNAESHKWEVIHKLSLGIARGLEYLHNGLVKPIIHGNLKSKNVLIDSSHQPRLSDFGMHLILNTTAGQEMLESSAAQGYKAPELIKMKDASKDTDIYSLGVILLEMVTRKEPTSGNLSHYQDPQPPTSLKTLLLENRLSGFMSQSRNQNTSSEDSLIMYFQLAMSCCSPTPALRPNIKHIIRKLEEIGV